MKRRSWTSNLFLSGFFEALVMSCIWLTITSPLVLVACTRAAWPIALLRQTPLQSRIHFQLCGPTVSEDDTRRGLVLAWIPADVGIKGVVDWAYTRGPKLRLQNALLPSKPSAAFVLLEMSVGSFDSPSPLLLRKTTSSSKSPSLPL